MARNHRSRKMKPHEHASRQHCAITDLVFLLHHGGAGPQGFPISVISRHPRGLPEPLPRITPSGNTVLFVGAVPSAHGCLLVSFIDVNLCTHQKGRVIMATKTFSSRVDRDALAYADAMTRREFGMSYGQYCGSVLIDAIRQGESLPRPSRTSETQRKQAAISTLKNFSRQHKNEAVGRLSDAQIKDLIASRYE